MAVIKCKMCGGDMTISPDKTFGTCEYCGSTMTLPKIDDDQRAAMFNRGNHFRRTGEFDKALAVYERIVAEDDSDAEAHWCCALCRFGIEYVEDPNTYEYVPTCHRASFESILQDVDYLAAIEHSDGITRRQYQKDAAKIAEVQKGVLAASQNEEPYDVFLCYKETDAVTGERSRDSLDAQEVYYRLTEKGYRVFFSRITLEDKAGTEYEPYIFAALNSAKVMIVLGSRPEHFSAVWVKNEWSRFLALMKKDRTKLLIPCYKNMDPYDLPEQLAVLQSYDMTKIGFMQDLIRGVEKVLRRDEPKETVKETVVVQQSTGGPNVTALLKRGKLALEDGEFDRAKEYFDQVLSMDAECAEAYWGIGLAQAGCRDWDTYIRKAAADVTPWQVDISADQSRIEAAVKQYAVPGFFEADDIRGLYGCFDLTYFTGKEPAEEQERQQRQAFEENRDFSRALRFADGGYKKELEDKRDALFAALHRVTEQAVAEEAIINARIKESYAAFLDQVDRDVKARSEKALEDRRAKEAADAAAAQKATEQAAKKKKLAIIGAAAAAAVLALVLLYTQVIVPASDYKKANALLEAGQYDEAVAAFTALGNYKDSESRLNQSFYAIAERLLADGQTAKAALSFSRLGDYSDARQRCLLAWDECAVRDTIAAGFSYTVGLRADGTVVAVGRNDDGQCDVSGWKDIVAVAAGMSHTVGLRSDGTVVAVGSNKYGQCDVSGWTDIVAIAAGGWHTVGLRSDGTVVAVGRNDAGQCDVSGWMDVVTVTAGDYHTIGLHANGTVAGAGSNRYGQCNVNSWRNTVAVAAGDFHTVGLRSDGTVEAVGENYNGQCGGSSWTEIVAVAPGYDHTVGLRADGTVVAVGDRTNGRCNVSEWTDIAAIAAGMSHTVGLRTDGTVVAVGRNDDGQCDVSDWTNIKLPK